ncbi:MAG: hypothetical protein BMS9Abin36_1882 [Gammaproteobacteria bacterium]|nr:MAG: hypothetical protein BMS9Abin36_1882 [Gammaproteobacteria bacterium]
MSQTNIIDSTQIKISPAAGKKLAELMADADTGMAGIRVFVAGGGCGGMQYDMTFAETTSQYDSLLEGEGYTLVVDSVALNYLEGCDIDFVQQGLNTSFVFNNVFNAVGGSGACSGCGGGGF